MFNWLVYSYLSLFLSKNNNLFFLCGGSVALLVGSDMVWALMGTIMFAFICEIITSLACPTWGDVSFSCWGCHLMHCRSPSPVKELHCTLHAWLCTLKGSQHGTKWYHQMHNKCTLKSLISPLIMNLLPSWVEIYLHHHLIEFMFFTRVITTWNLSIESS